MLVVKSHIITEVLLQCLNVSMTWQVHALLRKVTGIFSGWWECYSINLSVEYLEHKSINSAMYRHPGAVL